MRERAAPEGSQTKREDKEGRGCGCELACVISVEGHSLWKRSSDKKKKPTMVGRPLDFSSNICCLVYGF